MREAGSRAKFARPGAILRPHAIYRRARPAGRTGSGTRSCRLPIESAGFCAGGAGAQSQAQRRAARESSAAEGHDRSRPARAGEAARDRGGSCTGDSLGGTAFRLRREARCAGSRGRACGRGRMRPDHRLLSGTRDPRPVAAAGGAAVAGKPLRVHGAQCGQRSGLLPDPAAARRRTRHEGGIGGGVGSGRTSSSACSVLGEQAGKARITRRLDLAASRPSPRSRPGAWPGRAAGSSCARC
jgi:hypothetical protein